MRKIIISLLLIISLNISNLYAYNLTTNDYKIVNNISNKIESVIDKKGESYRNKYINQLKKISIKYSKNERLKTIIDEIVNSLDNEDLGLESMLFEGLKSSKNNEKNINLSDLASGVVNLLCHNSIKPKPTIIELEKEFNKFIELVIVGNINFEDFLNDYYKVKYFETRMLTYMDENINISEYKWRQLQYALDEIRLKSKVIKEPQERYSQSSGTAFFMKLGNGNKTIFTNKHVFEGMDRCILHSGEQIYYFNTNDYYVYNDFSDFGLFYIEDSELQVNNSKATEKVKNAFSTLLNYKISSLNNCSSKMNIGEKVYVIGYPKFGETSSDYTVNGQIITASNKEQILTDGIISGTYNSNTVSGNKNNKTYPYNNYYVSNKMDSGNSGGPAFAEVNGELCLLGIATWVNTGNFDNQGIIQNIHNIYNTEK